jgi:purine catabolism regulator
LGLSVQQIIELNELTGTKLLAGGKGISRVVENVTVLEIPDVEESWLLGNELILSTLYNFSEKMDVLEILVKLFHRKNVACLAIHPGAEMNESVLNQLISCADELDFPILQIPRGFSYVKIINSVLSRIINQQAYLLEKSQSISHTFNKILLNGGNLDSICRTLCNFIQHPVIILDVKMNVLSMASGGKYTSLFHPPLTTEKTEEFIKCLKDKVEMDMLELKNQLSVKLFPKVTEAIEVLIVPIIASKVIYGYVIVKNTNQDKLSDTDFLAIEHSITTLAIEMLKQQAVKETEQMLERDFIEELLQDQISDEYEIFDRIYQLNIPFHTFQRVCLLSIKSDLKSKYYLKTPLSDIIKKHVQKEPDIKVYSIKDKFVFLSGKHVTDHLLKDIFRHIEKDAYEGLKVKTCFGMGLEKKEIQQLHESYEEAIQAVTVGVKVKNETIHDYKEMGLYNLLYQLSDKDNNNQWKAFCTATVGSVVEHDQKYNSELVRTLEVYVEEKESYKLTAERLFVHPNTVKYRLDKIKEILGEDFLNGESRLNIELALKGLKLFQ